jgi:hypothetical protein
MDNSSDSSCVTSGCGCGYKLNVMKHKGRKLPGAQEENRSWLFKNALVVLT